MAVLSASLLGHLRTLPIMEDGQRLVQDCPLKPPVQIHWEGTSFLTHALFPTMEVDVLGLPKRQSPPFVTIHWNEGRLPKHKSAPHIDANGRGWAIFVAQPDPLRLPQRELSHKPRLSGLHSLVVFGPFERFPKTSNDFLCRSTQNNVVYMNT